MSAMRINLQCRERESAVVFACLETVDRWIGAADLLVLVLALCCLTLLYGPVVTFTTFHVMLRIHQWSLPALLEVTYPCCCFHYRGVLYHCHGRDSEED